MRTSSQWRHWQKLGRAFTAKQLPPASYEANSSFVSWSKPVEQISKSSTSPVNWIEQENKLAIGWSSIYPRQVSSIANQELGGLSAPNSRHASLFNPKLFSFNPSQGLKLPSVRTRVSNAVSREPEYWDTPESRTQSGEGQQADQVRVPREWEHDEDKDLTRDREVRKEIGHTEMKKDGDGVEWGQQHLRLREYETRQKTSFSPNPPQFHKDDVYIPVKACYISRR